ncbi:MAG TPA: GDSL-type esterase/lipase family protein [Planctomycetota bacterium]|nr:GDSL-type esterase/lipase family protein [Planctomycetota bacterium]
MDRRIFIVTSILIVCVFCVYLLRYAPKRATDPFALAPIFQRADEFDAPYESDPELVREFAAQKIEFPFKPGDRVAWIGSSSTFIGEWPSTMEFLLRSRHPELQLSFSRYSTGGGTFASALSKLPDWLEQSHPTLVFFNFGANDAAYGKQSLDDFRAHMRECIELVQKSGARVIVIAHQSADIRVTGPAAYYRRKHYADEMLSFCKANGWTIVDIHHPLEELQHQAQAEDNSFCINWDTIHLTDSGYVAWAYFLYDRLNPPDAESALDIDADIGRVARAVHCSARVISSRDDLAFERTDDVLPILPPNPLPLSIANRGRILASRFSAQALDTIEQKEQTTQSLPPRKFVPIEALSKYMLKVTGLAVGEYSIECNGKLCGRASAVQLGAGVNLNSLVLDAGVEAPWNDLAGRMWAGAAPNVLTERTMIFRVKLINPK